MAKKDTKKDVSISKQDKKMKKPSSSRALSPFEEMEREMEQLFGRFGHGWMRPFRWGGPFWSDMMAPFEGKIPSVDVIDREGEVLVRAELPGVDKKDLDVTMTESSITIKGSTSSEEEQEEGDYYRREMSRGEFSRTVSLPAEVDGAAAKASFKDGLLELTLPKVKKAIKHKVNVE